MKKMTKKLKMVRASVVTGMLFPLIAIASDLLYNHTPLTWTSLVQLYARGPSHWIILTIPFALGLIGYFFNKKIQDREFELEEDTKRNVEQLKQLGTYIEDLEHGIFLQRNYSFDNPQLTRVLNSLTEKLATQKEQDERARWVAEGHAKFGEILRLSHNLKQLAEEVLTNLVRYLKLNQGSIFIQEQQEQEERLVMQACYAYDKKKYTHKSLALGEGLVGQCYLEGESIFLKKVPSDYIKITSGLGEATATFVVIVPMKANHKTEGIIELAGFTTLEKYQVAFIEKVGEAFASTIHSVKVSGETKKLLEETQYQTEQLRLQEEEIRQNMEEMQATQEQLTRQLEESRILRERVERRERVMALTTILSETDLQGNILFANDKFCEVSKYAKEELIGKPQNIVRHPDMPKELFKLLWQTIKKGEVFKGIVKNRAKDGSHYWVEATIVPILDGDGEVMKYVGSRFHITDDSLALALYNKQADLHHWPRL